MIPERLTAVLSDRYRLERELGAGSHESSGDASGNMVYVDNWLAELEARVGARR
jgi:hypothetical protein